MYGRLKKPNSALSFKQKISKHTIFCCKNKQMKRKPNLILDGMTVKLFNTRHWRDSSVGRATD